MSLARYLTELHSKPYHPVTHNCCTFAYGALRAQRDGLPDNTVFGVRCPDTEAGVIRALAELGGVRGLLSAYFGSPPRTDAARAKRGDLALFDGSDGETVGVVEVGGAVCLSPSGLKRYPMGECKGYWPV